MTRTYMDESEESTNRFIRDEAESMAESLGLDELPLRDPGINFFQAARAVVDSQSRKYFRLDQRGVIDKTLETIHSLFLGESERNQKGSIYNYPRYYEASGMPFDAYFLRGVAVRCKALFAKEMRHRSKAKSVNPDTPGLPLSISNDDEHGISEGAIPGHESDAPSEILGREENSRKLQKILNEEVPRIIEGHKDPKTAEILLAIWWLRYKEHMSPAEATRALNERGYRSKTGKEFSHGVVARYFHDLETLIREYYEGRGVDLRHLLVARPRNRLTEYRSPVYTR